MAKLKEIAPTQTPEKKSTLERWALIIGLIASIGTIAGYTIKDCLESAVRPSPIESPSPTTKEPVVTPKSLPKKADQVASGRSNKESHTEIINKGDIGVISTGDSANISVSQTFN